MKQADIVTVRQCERQVRRDRHRSGGVGYRLEYRWTGMHASVEFTDAGMLIRVQGWHVYAKATDSG